VIGSVSGPASVQGRGRFRIQRRWYSASYGGGLADSEDQWSRAHYGGLQGIAGIRADLAMATPDRSDSYDLTCALRDMEFVGG
jgi:hypothetical protein